MKIDGTAFALTYVNASQPDGHTVVVMGVSYNNDGTPKSFRCWDNAGEKSDGSMSTVYPGSVIGVYKVKKENYNPWTLDFNAYMNRYIFEK